MSGSIDRCSEVACSTTAISLRALGVSRLHACTTAKSRALRRILQSAGSVRCLSLGYGRVQNFSFDDVVLEKGVWRARAVHRWASALAEAQHSLAVRSSAMPPAGDQNSIAMPMFNQQGQATAPKVPNNDATAERGAEGVPGHGSTSSPGGAHSPESCTNAVHSDTYDNTWPIGPLLRHAAVQKVPRGLFRAPALGALLGAVPQHMQEWTCGTTANETAESNRAGPKLHLCRDLRTLVLPASRTWKDAQAQACALSLCPRLIALRAVRLPFRIVRLPFELEQRGELWYWKNNPMARKGRYRPRWRNDPGDMQWQAEGQAAEAAARWACTVLDSCPELRCLSLPGMAPEGAAGVLYSVLRWRNSSGGRCRLRTIDFGQV